MTQLPTSAAINQQIASNLREARRVSGVTLSELATSSGLTPKQILNIEMGLAAIRADALLLLSLALGTSITGLLPDLSPQFAPSSTLKVVA